jgi:hypothetical protein
LVAIFTIDGPKASRSAGNAVNEVGALINLNTAKVLRLTVIDEKGCMSAFGPKRTCRKTQSTSLLGVKRTWRLHCTCLLLTRSGSWINKGYHNRYKFSMSVNGRSRSTFSSSGRRPGFGNCLRSPKRFTKNSKYQDFAPGLTSGRSRFGTEDSHDRSSDTQSPRSAACGKRDARVHRAPAHGGVTGRKCRAGHAISPHPSSREGHHSTARWSSSRVLLINTVAMGKSESA